MTSDNSKVEKDGQVRTLDYRVLFEGWLKCKIRGTELVIKAKPVITRMIEGVKSEEEQGVGFSIQTLSMVEGIIERHEPSADQTVKAEDILKDKPIEFDMIEPTIQVYYVPTIDQILLVKPYVTKVFATKKFDRSGFPIYSVQVGASITSVQVPED
ncbi:MAG TPA: hypothetical protein VGQ13_04055 [Nitrososphaera sp.]|nr:hypothetical protein [Nitrososphaera sp.]